MPADENPDELGGVGVVRFGAVPIADDLDRGGIDDQVLHQDPGLLAG
jgi:hypothetical protein